MDMPTPEDEYMEIQIAQEDGVLSLGGIELALMKKGDVVSVEFYCHIDEAAKNVYDLLKSHIDAGCIHIHMTTTKLASSSDLLGKKH